MNAAHAPPLPEADRAWRFRFEACELWCVASDEARRNILHCVLQGPSRQELTALEQSIIAQWLRKLVASAGAGDATEGALPVGGPAWRCDVEVLQTSWPAIRLHFLTAASGPRPLDADARVRLEHVPIRMNALIPLGSAPLHEIFTWEPGARIELRLVLMPLTAGLFIAGRRVAAVEVGGVGGERALRLTRLAPPAVASAGRVDA